MGAESIPTRFLVSALASFARHLEQLRATDLTAQQKAILEDMLEELRNPQLRLLPGHQEDELPSYSAFIQEGTTRFRTLDAMQRWMKSLSEGAGAQSAAMLPVFVRLKRKQSGTEGEYEEHALAAVDGGRFLVTTEDGLALHASSTAATACIVVLKLRQATTCVQLESAVVLSENEFKSIRTKTRPFGDFPHCDLLSQRRNELSSGSSLLENVGPSRTLLAHNPADLLMALQPGADLSRFDFAQQQRQVLLCITLSQKHDPTLTLRDSLAHLLCEESTHI